MPECVLVTEPEFRKAGGFFSSATDLIIRPAPVEEPRLAEAVIADGARAVILGAKRYAGALYEALGRTGGPSGAILARFGVGHDGVDKAQAHAQRIVVTNTPGVLDASVAEHTLWLMGCLARHVAQLDGSFRAGQFAPQTGVELEGKTFGLIGWGGIARHVARIAHFGLGMRVLACGRRPAAQLAADWGQPLAALESRWGLEQYTTDADSIFREADVVSLHVPATAETHHFANAHRLGLLRRTALLINTARGSVLDEAALFEALSAARIAGAALDVFEAEPYVPAAPGRDLRRLPNVVLTPHVGSNTREANYRMAEAALANVRAFFARRLEALSRVASPTGDGNTHTVPVP